MRWSSRQADSPPVTSSPAPNRYTTPVNVNPRAFRPPRPRRSKLGFLPTLHCQSMQLLTITDSAFASGKVNQSRPCVRWLKAQSDHGRTTSTTRCTWTGLRRSSQRSRPIAATPAPPSRQRVLGTGACQTGAMSELAFDQRFWEGRWSQVLRDHPDQAALRPPNQWLTTEVVHLEPSFALDAGCGHGADTLWLAARGWHVTAVDFSETALAIARSTSESVGMDVARRIDWVEGDLSTWTPLPAHYGLVLSLYVHVADSVDAMVQRLASGVGRGGTLFLVGHRPIDPSTRAETPAAGQLQISVDAALAALDSTRWTVLIAEDRPRPQVGTGVDAVILARRYP